MPQTKYFLPSDLKMRCLSYVRGYSRMSKIYLDEREEILKSSPAPSDGQPKGNTNGDECLTKTILLQKLEEKHDTKIIKAIDNAKLNIGINILSEKERERLIEAVVDSCIEGRNFIFEYRNLYISKSAFYNERQCFLYYIAKKLNFI